MFKIFEKIISNSIKEQRFENQKNIKLIPGIKVYAKVVKTNGSRALLDLNGLKILATSNRELKSGEIVKLQVLKIRENEIFVKLDEKTSNSIESVEKSTDIRKLLLTLSVEEKIYLKNNEIEDILKKYNKISEKESDISLLKALLVAVKLDRTDADVITSLKAYFDKEIKRDKLKLDDNLSKNLKKEVEKIISGRETSDRGINILNKLNIEASILSFLFGIENLVEPLSLTIKDYTKKEENTKKIYNIILKAEFEKLGLAEIHIFIKGKKIFLNFYFEKMINRDHFFEKIEKCKAKIKGKNFIIEDITLSTKIKDDREIGNINIRG